MIPVLFTGLWLLCLVNFVSSLLAGHSAYTVTEDDDDLHTLNVFTTGYEDGDEPVVRARVDSFSYTITCDEAYNAFDNTDNKLFLNQILMALWERKGNDANELVTFHVSSVSNSGTVAAVQVARTANGKVYEPFRVTEDNGGWRDILQSPFGKVARRLAAEAGKKLTAVTLGWIEEENVEDVEFEFA